MSSVPLCGRKNVAREWLATPCTPPVPEHVAGIAKPIDGIQLRHVRIHESHEVRWLSDLSTWLCTTCGLFGIEVLEGLDNTCSQVRTRAGKQNIARVKRGFMPGESRLARAFSKDRIVRTGSRTQREVDLLQQASSASP